MTNLSASDIAGLRIREARKRLELTREELAARCEKAGAGRLTASVITNLEGRRRASRELSVDELLILAWVLKVPPVQFLTPFRDSEALKVVPGEGMGPIEATAWLTDDDAASQPIWRAARPVALDAERVLLATSSPLTVMRQIRTVTRSIADHDRAATDEWYRSHRGGTVTQHVNAVGTLSVRLAHLLDAMKAFGYPRLSLPRTEEIVARYEPPPPPGDWDEAGEEVPDGARP